MSIWARSFIALAVLASFFPGRAIYYLLYALLGAYALHRVSVTRALRGLAIRRGEREIRLFPGERARVTLLVSNRSRAPLPWLALRDRTGEGLFAVGEREFALALPPRGEAQLDYEIEAISRGRRTLGPVEIETGDPFGIERFQAEGRDRTEVLVYPRVHPIESLGIPAEAHGGAIRAGRFADPSRVAGVRAYTAGDSIRHVHWRATAHTGQIQVKKFEPVGTVDLAVVLDLAYAHYDSWSVSSMSELAVETAASLISFAARRRQSFALYAHGDVAAGGTGQGDGAASGARAGTPFFQTGFSKGEEHLETCLEALALVQLTNRPFDGAALVDAIASSLRRETTVIWIGPQLGDEAAAGLAHLGRRGFRTLFVHVTTGGGPDRLPPGIGYARVTYPGDVPGIGSPRNPS